MEGSLICNYKTCQIALTSDLCTTKCSHVFCNEHSPASKPDKKCPLCSTDLSGEYAFCQKMVNPPEEYKSMVLAGQNPSTIIEIGNRAIAFWKYQMLQEKMCMKSVIKQLETRLTQAESTLQASSERLKDMIQQESQKCESLQKELRSYMKRTQLLEEKIADKNKQIQSCYMKLEEMQKQAQYCITSEFAPNRNNNNGLNISPSVMNRTENDEVHFMVYSQQVMNPSSRSQSGFPSKPDNQNNKVQGKKYSFLHNYC